MVNYRNFGNLLEIMNELCMKWIVLLEFNEISIFCFDAITYCDKEK